MPIDRIVGQGCAVYTLYEEANVLIGQTLYRLAFAAAALVVSATVTFGQATDKSAPHPIVLLAAIEGPSEASEGGDTDTSSPFGRVIE